MDYAIAGLFVVALMFGLAANADKRYIFLFCLLLFGTGCSLDKGFVANTRFGDYAELSGTPEGINALFDGLNGMAKTAKEGADTESDYFASRDATEKERTTRELKNGFFSTLFGQNLQQTKE